MKGSTAKQGLRNRYAVSSKRDTVAQEKDRAAPISHADVAGSDKEDALPRKLAPVFLLASVALAGLLCTTSLSTAGRFVGYLSAYILLSAGCACWSPLSVRTSIGYSLLYYFGYLVLTAACICFLGDQAYDDEEDSGYPYFSYVVGTIHCGGLCTIALILLERCDSFAIHPLLILLAYFSKDFVLFPVDFNFLVHHSLSMGGAVLCCATLPQMAMKNASKTVLVAEIGSVAINLKGACKSAITDLGPVTWFPLTRLYGFHLFCQFWFLDVSWGTKVAYSVPALGLLVVNNIGFIEWYLTEYFPGVPTVWFWLATFLTYGLYGVAFRMNNLRC